MPRATTKPPRPPTDFAVAYLGPGGTHSHLMAITLFGAVDDHGFRYEPRDTLTGVVEAVRSGEVGWGVVPYFNTTSGPVRAVYPALIDVEHGSFEELEVVACVSWPVSHDLLGVGRLDQVGRVYSKQEAIEQCSCFLKDHFNAIEVVPASSTAEAVRRAARDGPHSAAIASRRLCEFYIDVKTLFEDIQDDRRNLTRFLVIRRSNKPRKSAREHDRYRQLRHTWVLFDSSAQSDVLPRMISAARDWGVAASSLIGVVTDPHAFGMRFLLELDWPRDSLKIQFLLGDTKHLRRRVVACPMVVDSPMIPRVREWLAAQAADSAAGADIDSGVFELLDEQTRYRLAKMSGWRLFAHAPVETMADVWAVLGLPAGRMLNSQVLRNNDTRDLAVCGVPAGRRVSDTRVSTLLGGDYRRLKRPEFHEYGLEPGTVSPLTAPERARVLIDTAIETSGWLFMGSGNPSISIAVQRTNGEWPFSAEVAQIVE